MYYNNCVSKKAKLKQIEIEKLNNKYENKLKVVNCTKFHDRYIIVDNAVIYHCGASINHAGKRVFNINRLEDNLVRDSIFSYLNLYLN